MQIRPTRNATRQLAAFAILALLAASTARAASEPDPKLRAALLDQLKSTHTTEDWFVPIDVAVADLTPEQANWTPGKDSHSVAQLATHLLFWNGRILERMKGVAPADFTGDNKETFAPVDATSWPDTVRKLDAVLAEMEKIVAEADATKLDSIADTVAHVSAHNAYHVGQILYVRKLQGVWNPDKGVK